jgi:hypothetical protein
VDVGVVGTVVPVHMPVPSPIAVLVFVLVKSDLQCAVKGVGNSAKRAKTRQMFATLEPGNHRLCHPKPTCELLLRFTALCAQGG